MDRRRGVGAGMVLSEESHGDVCLREVELVGGGVVAVVVGYEEAAARQAREYEGRRARG